MVLLGWLALQTATGLDPDVLRLARIKTRMEEVLRGMPNYTCTQTIERSRRRARSRRFELVDTIRLEVALFQGRELFAWPGAGKFEDREIGELVGGTIGNGNFAGHARAVLLGSTPTFTYEGVVQEGGRALHRYRYHVPRYRSGYTLRDGRTQGIAGYRGSFDADGQTFEVARLEVIAEDIPGTLAIAAARDEMRYERMRIGEADFLLPRSSVLTLTDIEGTENQNRVRFSSCRQYSGESTISFADAPQEGDTPPAPPVDVELPDGLVLDVELTTAIPLNPAPIGLPVEGRTRGNARWQGKTMVPRDASVQGRVRLWRQSGKITLLSLELVNLEFPGAHARLRAVPDQLPLIPRAGISARVDSQGMILISGMLNELTKGTRMLWRVEARPPSATSDTGRQSK